MELRAIREKLQSLQQEPLSTEATTLPWNGRSDTYWPKETGGSKETGRQSPVSLPQTSPDQIRTTVETLRQRSSQQLRIPPQLDPVAVPVPEVDLAQYLQQLQQQAQQVNQLSLAQAEALLKLKSLSDRYALDLKQQAARGGYEPAVALPLCEFESALVPDVQQDHQGYLTVTYRSLDLQEEEHYAYELAESLRHRGGLQPWLGESTTASDLGVGAILAEPLKALQTLESWGQQQFSRWRRSLNLRSKRGQRPLASSPITFLDAVIWFSGAAMVRVGINFLLAANPLLRLPLMLLLLGFSAGAIYRAVLCPKPDYSLGYRLLIAIAGLIVGGRL